MVSDNDPLFCSRLHNVYTGSVTTYYYNIGIDLSALVWSVLFSLSIGWFGLLLHADSLNPSLGNYRLIA